MKVREAIEGALGRVRDQSRAVRFGQKLIDYAARRSHFNAQRAHRHPATMGAARRGKLRRS
jgi:hypothetical protein